jgi:hypothetical protein
VRCAAWINSINNTIVCEELETHLIKIQMFLIDLKTHLIKIQMVVKDIGSIQ